MIETTKLTGVTRMATVNGLTVTIRMTRMVGMTGMQVWLTGMQVWLTRMARVNGLTVTIKIPRMAEITGINRITRMKRDKSLG